MQFYSKHGQDQFLFEHYFYRKRDRFFVDIGADDGVTHSSSLTFERFLDWKGICIEPSPQAFAKLRSERGATCLNCRIASDTEDGDGLPVESPANPQPEQARSPAHPDRVPARRIDRILAEHAVRHVDFCAIDCSGSELMALQTIDFSSVEIDVLEVENNSEDPTIHKFLSGAGFEHVAHFGDHSEIYVRRGFKRRPRTTVICAVWSREAGRGSLLEGHMANLDRQDRDCERIYVFDEGVLPPAGLKGVSLTVNRPLTIYQAWNLAIAAADTTYIMNLNLDDRLAPDAIKQLEFAADSRNAILVGGDWRVCYSQAQTDEIRPCEPAERLPFVSGWPPQPGTVTRYGSGAGNRFVFGPALFWRLDVLLRRPRMPWRFADGTPIRTIGDIIWTGLLQADDADRCVKLPWIIGNYHSHPTEQAEFRHPVAHEKAQLARLGLNPL